MNKISYSYIDRMKQEQERAAVTAAPAPEQTGEEILDQFFDRVIWLLQKFLVWYGIPFTVSVVLSAAFLWWL